MDEGRRALQAKLSLGSVVRQFSTGELILSALFRLPVPGSNRPLEDVGSASAMDGSVGS
jgi:hypothetical protein